MVLWEPVDSGAVPTFLFLLINDKFPCFLVIECLYHLQEPSRKASPLSRSTDGVT